MTQEERISQLEAENIALKVVVNTKTKLSLKVSAKGAVSLYGLGKWPVTLYASQWERVLAKAEEINRFCNDNKHILAVKEGEVIELSKPQTQPKAA